MGSDPNAEKLQVTTRQSFQRLWETRLTDKMLMSHGLLNKYKIHRNKGENMGLVNVVCTVSSATLFT